MIEADVWYRGRDVYVRHERRLRWLPVLADQISASMPVIGPWALKLPGKYFLRPDFRPLRLAEVLRACRGEKGVLVDVKGSDGLPEYFAAEIVRRIEGENAAATTVVCGYWPVLDAIRKSAPRVQVRYTVSTPKRLAAYLARLEKGEVSAGVCAFHPLLDEKTTQALSDRGVDAFAWTVDDADEARALVERGVAGITSNDLELLAALRAPPAEEHL
jgi:glycerophosphoryl diester phosphodiesterase